MTARGCRARSARWTALALVALAADAAAAPELGQPAPDFALRDREGALFRLSDRAYPAAEQRHRKKAPLLVDFFRTDCKPCRAALPKLVDLHKRFAGRGLQIVLVALLEEQEGSEKLDAFLEQQRLPFTVLVDAYGVAGGKYVRSGERYTIPATFVVDRGGVLRERFGAIDDKQLKRLTKLVEQLTTGDRPAGR